MACVDEELVDAKERRRGEGEGGRWEGGREMCSHSNRCLTKQNVKSGVLIVH